MAPPGIRRPRVDVREDPPCPNCETFNNLDGEALAALDQAAQDTGTGSASQPNRDTAKAPDAPSVRPSEARPPTDTASRTDAGERSFSSKAPSDLSGGDAFVRSAGVRLDIPVRQSIPPPISSHNSTLVSSLSTSSTAARPVPGIVSSDGATRNMGYTEGSRSGNPASYRSLSGVSYGSGGQSSPRSVSFASNSMSVQGTLRYAEANFSGSLAQTKAYGSMARGGVEGGLMGIFGSAADPAAAAKAGTGLAGLWTSLVGVKFLSFAQAVLPQGLVQLITMPGALAGLTPSQAAALQKVLATLAAKSPPTLALGQLPLLWTGRDLSGRVGLFQGLEKSALKFAGILSADYLAKMRKGEKTETEAALTDKLGLFVKNKIKKRLDSKRLQELRRRLRFRVEKKQDAEWEEDSRKKNLLNTDSEVQ